MFDSDTTHKLLRELLNETRELRRQMVTQSAHLASLEHLALEASSPEARESNIARIQAFFEEKRKLNRRIHPSQVPLIDWLASQGLVFQGFVAERHGTGPADEISELLATSYELLSGFVKALIGAHAAKDGLSYPITGLRPGEAEGIFAFAQRLEDLGMVRAMSSTATQIHIEPLLGQKVELLLSGGWLERAVYNLATRVKPREWAPRCIVANLKCRNASEETYEIDLLLPVSGEPPLCLDSKTGTLAQSKGTLNRNHNALKLPKERNFVILPSANPQSLRAWRDAIPFATVLPYAKLEAALGRF